ncbi:TonB-dependent receptor plug [Flammeovirgaceae bacterium 311]|nr:TonB-dependent receptor plug [Flammeovirgaceae bacterium 311]
MLGATVTQKGTSNGTVVNTDGRYTIEVPGEDAVLVYSFLGYDNQEITVGSRTTINVTLAESISELDEVVVVGYGTQKKVSMTSAVSQVEGEDLERMTTSNVQQSLQGQISGLTILDEGAAPGKENIHMRIRGITTLSGQNSPLVIVDGVEQPITNLNPADIESISVLKDASSTAIYGSRAANGVVLVTTKRAKENKLSVTYNGYYGVQRSNNTPEHMGLEDYMRLQNIAWTNSTGSPIYTEEHIQEYVNATDRLKYPLPNTWYDAVLRPGPQIENSLSISGGSDLIKSRLSLRYRDQEGIIANSGAKIAEMRLNTDFKVSPKINISTDINYRHNNILSPVDEWIVFYSMLQTSQWTVPQYPDGTYGISSDGHNPLMYSEIAGTSRTQNEYILGNVRGEWDIVKGLKFSTQLTARLDRTNGKNYRNRYEVRDYYNPDIIAKSVPINSLTEVRNDVREFTINNLLNYSNTIGSHYFNVLAGYSQIQNEGSNLNAYRQNFYNNDIQSIGQGANDATKNNNGNEYGWGLRSYFSRVNYSYRDKYLLEANGRFDGSSRFLGDNKYSFFPSFSAGWRVSEENFWGEIGNLMNELKFRGSWGKTGNQAVALYSGIPTLGSTTYSFSGVPVRGFAQYQMANEDLTWETTTQTNVGVDAQFFNNRISLSVDYYNKVTDDILLQLPVPGIIGLSAPPQNAGRVDNKGWEFLLGAQNNFGKLYVNANVNFSYNKNTVVDLAGTGPYISSFGNETRWITAEGYPIETFWGYRTDGLFQTQEEVDNYPTLFSGTAPGDVKYVDLNEDGIISADDMTYLGQSFPKYNFGSNLNFSYGGFNLNLLFQGAAGAQTRVGGALIEMGIWGGFTHEIITDNYWTPENPDARFPRPLKYDLRNFHFSDKDLMDRSYLRLKNIRLGYEIPATLIERVGLSRFEVYVASTNLLTFSELNEWNIDPETNDGTRTEAYPQTSISTIGVNIQF